MPFLIALPLPFLVALRVNACCLFRVSPCYTSLFVFAAVYVAAIVVVVFFVVVAGLRACLDPIRRSTPPPIVNMSHAPSYLFAL